MNSVLDNITFRQIKTLIETINTISGKDYEVIQRSYKSNAENFEGALTYLSGLKLISVTNGKVIPTRSFKKFLDEYIPEDTLTKSYLLEKALNSNNSFSNEVLRYLNNFRVSTGDMFEYKPATGKRLRESGIRNLFVELDLVRYDKISNSYKIKDKYFSIFANYFEKKKLPLKELSYLIGKQEELGMAAELEILDYEKKRLANHPELLQHLQHVSELDAKAGYDIKSYEIEPTDNEKPKSRYIEVKAVSKFSFKFNWTRNEINKSKLYGKQYYLYLLPVISDKKFDITGLEIIQNPFEKVFTNKNDWEKIEEQYRFWKKK